MMVINPGSENKGGTLKQAVIIASEWLQSIYEEGVFEVEVDGGREIGNGNFEFVFTHSVTKKEVILQTHGFTKEECDKFIFHPRVYWNGSSTGNPEIEDWLTDDFKYRIEYYK